MPTVRRESGRKHVRCRQHCRQQSPPRIRRNAPSAAKPPRWSPRARPPRAFRSFPDLMLRHIACGFGMAASKTRRDHTPPPGGPRDGWLAGCAIRPDAPRPARSALADGAALDDGETRRSIAWTHTKFEAALRIELAYPATPARSPAGKGAAAAARRRRQARPPLLRRDAPHRGRGRQSRPAGTLRRARDRGQAQAAGQGVRRGPHVAGRQCRPQHPLGAARPRRRPSDPNPL